MILKGRYIILERNQEPLRENRKLGIFTKISVTKEYPGGPWIIEIKQILSLLVFGR